MRGLVDFGGALHGERLVGSFGVEFLPEIVEARLLLEAVHAWRSGGFLFEREMHALMAAVVLRMTSARHPQRASLAGGPGLLRQV